MSMIDIFKDTLQEGMEITACKELASKYKVTLSYKGMTGNCELGKTCAPKYEISYCRKAIDSAVSSMYINAGNLVEAKAWLDGEKWKEEKKTVTRIITLTEEEIDCFNAYIESEKVDVAFGNTDWCSVYHKIVGDKVSDYAKDKMDLYQL